MKPHPMQPIADQRHAGAAAWEPNYLVAQLYYHWRDADRSLADHLDRLRSDAQHDFPSLRTEERYQADAFQLLQLLGHAIDAPVLAEAPLGSVQRLQLRVLRRRLANGHPDPEKPPERALGDLAPRWRLLWEECYRAALQGLLAAAPRTIADDDDARDLCSEAAKLAWVSIELQKGDAE